MKYFSLFFALMYVYFIAVQYNDPDPLVWMGIYGFALVISLLAFFKKGNTIISVLAIIAYIIGAFFQWPQQYEGISMPMEHSMNIEEARESLGLAICAFTTFVNIFIVMRLKKSS